MKRGNETMRYTGTINEADATRYGLPRRAVFINNGYWTSNGKPYGSYILEDETIEQQHGKRYQFSRTRNNVFFVETVDD